MDGENLFLAVTWEEGRRVGEEGGEGRRKERGGGREREEGRREERRGGRREKWRREERRGGGGGTGRHSDTHTCTRHNSLPHIH